MVIFVRMPQIGERIYLLEGMAVDEARCAFVLRKSEVGHDRLDLSASWGKGAYAFFPKGYLLSSDKAVEVQEYFDRSSAHLLAWFHADDGPQGLIAASSAEQRIGIYGLKWGTSSVYQLHFTPGFSADLGLDSIVLKPTPGKPFALVIGGELLETGSDWKLSFGGQAPAPAGCLAFSFAVKASKIDSLQAELRYTQGPPPNIGSTLKTDPAFKGLRVRIFQEPHSRKAVDFTAVLDPRAPEDHGRAYFALSPGQRLETWFTTVRGNALVLWSRESARLVFQTWPQATQRDGIIVQPYLVPAGQFGIGYNSSDDMKIVLGASLMEYVPLRKVEGAWVEFVPDQPAYLLASVNTDARPDQRVNTFGNRAFTAWLVCGTGSAERQSFLPVAVQSEEAALYKDEPREQPKKLVFDEVSFIPKGAYPAVSWRGLIASDAQAALAAETDVLALVRRSCLGTAQALTGSALTPNASERRTPQGFRIELGGNTWAKVVFVETMIGETKVEFGIEWPDSELIEVFQREEIFLIASRFLPRDSRTRFTGDLSIARWEFKGSLPIATTRDPKQPQPILIVKYGNRSVRSLLNDPSRWTGKERFVGDTAAIDVVQQQIDTLLQTADSQDPENGDLYDLFIERIDNANWNGILMFNVPVGLTLPEQIKGITGGINLEQFRAHHIGIDLTPIEKSAWHSMLFGLVEYPPLNTTPKPRESQQDEYGLTVKRLAVRFNNTQLDRFDCRIELKLGKLFRETSVTDDGDTIELVGTYESRVKDGQAIETYTFKAKKTYTFKLSSTFIKQIQLDSIGFRTLRVSGDKVETQFLLAGDISFEKVGAQDLLGLQNLKFDDLGIDMSFTGPGPLHFAFNPGLVRFDFSSKKPEGFLAKLPFRFNSFALGNGVELSRFGFRSIGGLGEVEPRFDYGFIFDLDLGSLGALAAKLKDVSFKFLIGWLPGARLPTFGFKLDGAGGSSLDLGIEGMIRLQVEKYAFQTIACQGKEWFVVGLENCRVEILNNEIPQKKSQKLNLYFFPNFGGGEGKRLAWFGSFADTNVTSGKTGIAFLALGQRINPFTTSILTTKEAVEKLKDLGLDDGKPDRLCALPYSPDHEWIVGLHAELGPMVGLWLLLNDPSQYGIRIAVQDIFELDLLYRKISDGEGVFSLEVPMPDSMRTMEVGAVSVTIPKIGIELYTSGGATVDIGFPHNRDFSRAMTAQAFPLIGSAGVYLSRASGKELSVVPQPIKSLNGSYDPVWRCGVALRLGLGKEFTRGPLQAKLSVSVYGTLEGVYAPLRPLNGNEPDKRLPREYIILKGVVGVLGQAVGVVDLSLVKAKLDLTLELRYGLEIETKQAVLVYLEGQVRIAVDIVIGEIRVWGATLKIEIHLCFETGLRYDWWIGQTDRSLFETHALAVKDVPKEEERWDRRPRCTLTWDSTFVFDMKQPLPIHFQPDVTRDDDGQTAIVLMLCLIEAPHAQAPPFTRLAQVVLTWTIWNAFKGEKKTSQVQDWTLTGEELKFLARCLQPENALSADDGFTHLTYEKIATLLRDNFDAQIEAVPTDPSGEHIVQKGFLFPVPPEVICTATTHPHPRRYTEPEVTDDYVATVRELMRRLAAEFEAQQDTKPLVHDKHSLAELLFVDWFKLLIRAGVDALWQTLIDLGKKEEKLGTLFAAMDVNHSRTERTRWDIIGASVTDLLLHGIRLPEPKLAQKANRTKGLFAAAELQFPLLATSAPLPSHYAIVLESAGNPWFAIPGDRTEFAFPCDTSVQTILQAIEQGPFASAFDIKEVPYGQCRRRRFAVDGRLVHIAPYGRALGTSTLLQGPARGALDV